MAKSTIQWTDETWNPTTGCTRISPGCWNCYAFQLHDQRHVAWKRGTWPDAPAQYHQPFSRVQLLPDRLAQPLHWRTPRRVFVDSMSDLFHEDVPDEYLDQVFAVMALCPHHTFQILTKRPERMQEYLAPFDRPGDILRAARNYTRADESKGPWGHISLTGKPGGWRIEWPLLNVHVGTSVENQDAADTRIPVLLQVPAAVRFLSVEPLLGPVDLGLCRICSGSPGICSKHQTPYDIGWVICGGESGPHARPMDPAWARSLITQCRASNVAVFVKQLGTVWTKESGAKDPHGGNPDEWPADLRVREMPEVRHAR